MRFTPVPPCGPAVFLGAALLLIASPAASHAGSPDRPNLDGLIGQLVAPSATVREAAADALVAAGEPALPALRHAALNHENGLVRRPALEVLYRIERKRTPAHHRLRGHQEAVNAVTYLPDGKHVLSGGQDGTVRLWDVIAGREVRHYRGHGRGVLALAVSADGRQALSGGLDGTARLWDVATGNEVRRLAAGEAVRAVAFLPDGHTTVVATGDEYFEHTQNFVNYTLREWDLRTGRETRRVPAIEYGVPGAAFGPGGGRAVFGFLASVSVWDVKAGKALSRPTAAKVDRDSEAWAVAISPDGRQALGAEAGDGLRLWDPATGKFVRAFGGYAEPIYGVAFTPDGRAAVTGGKDGAVRRWDLATGREVRTAGINTVVWCVAVSPDGRQVAGGGADGSVLVWRLPGDELPPPP